MPKYHYSGQPPDGVNADLVVLGVYRGNVLGRSAGAVDSAMEGGLSHHLAGTLKAKRFEGKLGQSLTFPTLRRVTVPVVMVVGLGEQSSVTHREIRRAAGVAARGASGYERVALYLDSEPRAAIEGFELGTYCFDKFLTEKARPPSLVLVGGAEDLPDIERALATTGSVAWARDIVNEPPSDKNPQAFAERVAERAAQVGGLTVEIFDVAAMEEMGMNGILTVGRGSDAAPRFVVVNYEPDGAQGYIGLVGKGITFDSGGLSIKTAEGMEKMKADCSGAAGVIGAISALPALGTKIKVTAAIALAENMPGGRAVKPGDVIRHYGGRTSEVLNTDAEGRLVLADSLAWMSECKPDAMVNMATLTGGVVVALGNRVAGVLSNSSELSRELLDAAGRTDEPLWELPLYEEYRSQMKSSVADIKNISGTRSASAIFGGLFLKDFVGEDTPWAHLDIAGAAWSDKADHYLPAGATGYGTRLLIDWIETRGHRS